MVGNWIPASTDLARKAKMLSFARAGGINRHEATGLLIDLWGYVSECCESGFLESLVLDDLVSLIGGNLEFWSAVAGASWIIVEETGLRIPDNQDHPWIKNGAKSRLMNARRQARARDKRNADSNAPPVTIRNDGALPQTENQTQKDRKTDLNSQTDASDVLDFDFATAQPFAEVFYRCTGSRKENDPFLWQVAVLASRGVIPEADAWFAADKAKTGNKNRAAYFRTILEGRIGGKAKLSKLLRRVRLTRDFPRAPPSPSGAFVASPEHFQNLEA